MDSLRLNTSQREFFSLVTEFIFSNPFGGGWAKAKSMLAETFPTDSYGELKKRLIHIVSDKVVKMVKADKGDIRKFSAQDRKLVESGFLLNTYLMFYDFFDELIHKQIEAGDTPCTISFANDAISMMVRCGFSSEEAARYFSMFFQMRRAYYFISRNIIGGSESMNNLRRDLWSNIFTRDIRRYFSHLWNRMEDYSTLLLGETGSGKGVAALAIGRSGYIPFNTKKGCFKESFNRAYIPINLSQFPEQLIESELFGHKKGAFTGAVSDYEGVFSQCSPYGAIFLDEIGEVPNQLQIKLLQVLQDREFSAVGSHKKLRFNGRVIAATNRSLNKLRRGKILRDDFYYRLCSDVITIPSLSQRLRDEPAELDELVSHILSRIVGQPSSELTAEILSAIRSQVPSDYAWPGNVRELEQCIRRILLRDRYEFDLPVMTDQDSEIFLIRGINKGALNVKELLSAYCRLLYNRHGTYEAVSTITNLDSRTAKKYINSCYQDFENRSDH